MIWLAGVSGAELVANSQPVGLVSEPMAEISVSALIRGRVLSVALIVLVFWSGAMSALDDFKCYKAKDLKNPKFVKTAVMLVDQFGINNGNFIATKPFLLCNPAADVGANPSNADDHLVCYKTKGPKIDSAARPQVEVSDEFGVLQLEVVKPQLLCVPSSKQVLLSETAGSFLALSYNVAGLPEGLSGSSPLTNTPLISPLLNAYDLVLAQESWQTPIPNPLEPLRVYHELLVADANHPYKSVSAPLPLGLDPARPSALVSDGLNRMSQMFFVEDVVREPWTDCHNSASDCLSLKGFSFARMVLTPGLTVDVYNLHMEAGGDPEDDALRDAGVTQLSTFITTVSPGRAVIVGGDFNLHTNGEPDSTQFQRLLSETGLVDVCAALSCPEPGRIDKFLFRSSGDLTITPTSWNFETATFVDGMGGPLSDHDPLAVGFDWAVPGE